jgi:cytochrome P450
MLPSDENTVNHDSAKRPPIVPGLPVIGSLLKTLGDPRDFLMQQYRELGPVFHLKAMHIDYVIMAGLDANQFVNSTGRDCFQSKTLWQGMMHELEADNFLIGLDGEEHTFLRKLFKNDFSKAAVEPKLDEIQKLCVDRFADYGNGEEIALVEPMLQLTSQMIGCVMTGVVPSNEELENFLYYVNEVTNHFALRRLPAWLLKLRQGRFKTAKKMTMAFAESVLDEHLSGTTARDNFVDSVLAASKQCPHLFAHGDLRFSAILPLFAGIDTLGQTLNYALYELHKNPDILKQVQEEIDAVFSKGQPSGDALKNMPLLNATIMETLRLHPSAFGMVRTASKDFVFADCLVKKGQDVVILTTAPHRMNEYFKQPEIFDIQRFMAPRFEHRKRNAFAPFGRGPHTCLGAGMAELLMAQALGSILYHYEFELDDKNKVYKERISPTPSLGRQLKLRLIAKRN